MSNITGYLMLAGGFEVHREFIAYYASINKAAASKGAEAFGIWGEKFSFSKKKFNETAYYVGNLHAETDMLEGMRVFNNDLPHASIALSNFETVCWDEYMEGTLKKDRNDILPMVVENIVVSLADMIKEPATLARLLQVAAVDEKANEKLAELSATYFGDVLGENTFAFASYDIERKRLSLSHAYKPLYYSIWQKGKSRYLVWSTVEDGLNENYGADVEVVKYESPPNTTLLLHLDKTGIQEQYLGGQFDALTPSNAMKKIVALETRIEYQNSRRSEENANSAVVYFDDSYASVVAATWACIYYKDVIITLLRGSKDFVARMGRYDDLVTYLKKTNPKCEIDNFHKIIENDGNFSIITSMAEIADANDIGSIVMPFNREHTATDTSAEFAQTMSQVLAMGYRTRPNLITPFAKYVAKDIYQMGLNLKAPLELAYDCWEDAEENNTGDSDDPCGECEGCLERQMAAAACGVMDLLNYRQPYPEAKILCEAVKTEREEIARIHEEARLSQDVDEEDDIDAA